MTVGVKTLWSPWIGISAACPCATALTLAPARLALALPTNPLHRLLTTLRRPRGKNKNT